MQQKIRHPSFCTAVSRTLTIFGMVTAVFFLSACSSTEPRPELAVAPPDTQAPTLTEEVSLQEDRARLDSLRAEVPTEIRRENDELALIIKDMANSDEDPSKIRERFNRVLRQYRESNDKRFRKEREDFNTASRLAKEDFLEKAKLAREKFLSRKRSPRERQKFFDRQETDRRAFFGEDAEKRRAFESSMTERRRNFEDHAREQSNKFNQEHRIYSQTYYERQKAEGLKKRMKEKEKRMQGNPNGGNGSPEGGVSPEDAALLREMETERTGKVTPLQSGDQ